MKLTRPPTFLRLWSGICSGGRPVDVNTLGDFLEGYLDGRFAQECVAVLQVNLEARRPLPFRLNTNAEIVVHLADLWFASVWDEQVFSDPPGRAQAAARWLAECGRMVAPVAGDPSPTAWPPMHAVGMVERFIRDDLGGGGIIAGFRKARAMATDGIYGGVGALRHRFLTRTLSERAKEVHQQLYSFLLGLDLASANTVAARAARVIGSFHPHRGGVTPTDVLARWGGTVEQHVMTLAEAAMPVELG